MADEHNADADADAQHASADARRSATPDGRDDRQLLISERDKAKKRARDAEAEAAALREQLNSIKPIRDTHAKARLDSALTNVPPVLHKAAAALLEQGGFDMFDADLEAVDKMLREHGLIQTRNGGSSGIPGITTQARKEMSRTADDEALQRVLLTSKRYSDQAKGIDESGGVGRFQPRAPAPTVTSEQVEAIAKRNSARFRDPA